MKPSTIPTALEFAFKAQRPVMLWGSPGVGKSRIVSDFANKHSYELRDVRLSQLDSVDLRGVPSVEIAAHLTHWNPPEFLPREGRGILFLDEINSAPQSVQAAGYQLILDRRLGSYILPDEWEIVAAGNERSDRAIVNEMSTALRNRFTHIKLDVDAEDWCRWALRAGITDEVVAFIRFRPALLSEFTPRNNSAEEMKRIANARSARAFSSPRSWEYVSDIFKEAPPKEMEMELYAGCVGEGNATEFVSFVKTARELPNIDIILLSPKQAQVPTSPAALYAVSVALASRAKADNFERVMSYGSRLPLEFQALLVKDAIVCNEKIQETHAFTTWAIDNAQMLL